MSQCIKDETGNQVITGNEFRHDLSGIFVSPKRWKGINKRETSIETLFAPDNQVSNSDGLVSPNDISGKIIDAAMKVHTVLGPGLLESAYEACLRHELQKTGLLVERQKKLPLFYDGIKIYVGYRIDLLIENTVIVELKAVEKIIPIHEAQILSYLRLSGIKLGLLLNFNTLHFRDGIKRMVNNL